MTANSIKSERLVLPEWLTAIPMDGASADKLWHTIPGAMQDAKRWLLHKKKQPFCTDGRPRHGTLDSAEDTERLGTFEAALLALQRGGYDGLGFALGDGWQGIDLDKVEKNGLKGLADELPGYVERSPSGNGWHAIGNGRGFDTLASNHSGIEAYSGKRYFTVTGDQGRGEIRCIAGFIEQRLAPIHSSASGNTGKEPGQSGGKVAEGGRNQMLTSLGGTMRSRGFTDASIEVALQAENSSRCDPPLPDAEVKRIAKSVSRYPVTRDAALDDAAAMFSTVADDWPELQPLIARVDPQEYPLDAMPDSIRFAVQEVAGFVKAPIPLIATSALGGVSLGTQAHVDVERSVKLSGPCGLFLLAIADSGERKSTCDGYFTKAIRDYEAQQQEAAKPLIAAYKSEHDVWDAQRSGLKEKIKALAKEGKPSIAQVRELHELDKGEPAPPRIPQLIYGDATPEALTHSLAKEWPSGGVISSEAGSVFGSHGMSGDSVMRNLATLNQLWDGATLKTKRRTSESFTVRGARLTMALQVQEATIRAFFDSTKGLARGTGFLARFLVSWPESTQGFRPFTEAPANWPALAAFNSRLTLILNRPAPIDDDGALTPAMLTLAPDAKAAWVAFHDAIESELSTGKELFDVRDVASKTADNAARLAALFHTFTGSIGPIDLAAMVSATRIAKWHLHEARRFFGELAMPAELANPARLESWMLEYCQCENTDKVPTREIQRCGPNGLRDKLILAGSIKELAELGRARLVHDGKKRSVQINPGLLIGGRSWP